MAASFPETAISTERLLLRPLAEDDAPGLAAMMADELVLAWTDHPHPFTEAHALDLARTLAPAHRATGRGIVLAVTEHLTQRLVGLVELRHTDWRLRTTEISFVTAAWARGEGYAPRPSSASPSGSSRTGASCASNCAPPPGTPPPSRSPRRSAASARASCAAPG